MEISVSLPITEPLFEKKVSLLYLIGYTPHMRFKLYGNDYPFEVLVFIRLVIMNEIELNYVEKQALRKDDDNGEIVMEKFDKDITSSK